ncbi:hypothetical protein IAT38_007979 [Cryptococcus sp. DSM 104549]
MSHQPTTNSTAELTSTTSTPSSPPPALRSPEPSHPGPDAYDTATRTHWSTIYTSNRLSLLHTFNHETSAYDLQLPLTLAGSTGSIFLEASEEHAEPGSTCGEFIEAVMKNGGVDPGETEKTMGVWGVVEGGWPGAGKAEVGGAVRWVEERLRDFDRIVLEPKRTAGGSAGGQ